MWTEFLLAATHHVLVFAMFAIISVEIVYAKPGLNAFAVRRLGLVDRLYGIVSTLVLIVGFSRAIWGLKGWDYYEGNIIFWVKIGLFVLAGLLSVIPTVAFLKWNWRLNKDPNDLPSDAEVRANRKWLHMETSVMILIPIAAAALGRGMTD